MLNKILIAIIVIILLAGGGYYLYTMQQQDKDGANTPTPPPPPVVQVNPPPPPPAAVTVPDKALAKFETSAGNFEITLDGKAAPKTVANFIKLANENYYNGTKFFRVIKGFMIQGGDPNSKGTDVATYGQGGPDYTIPAEIGLKHNEGAISMARLPDQYNPKKDSSGSQFFIVLEESANNHTALDGGYSAFGYVTKGMDIVKKIGNAATKDNPYSKEAGSMPVTYIVINKVTIQEIK